MREPRNAMYILANARPTLYVGVTSDIHDRLTKHRACEWPDSFTSRCHIRKLVYIEYFDDIVDAIRREKQVKNYTRAEKLALIRAKNPTLRDLMPPAPKPEQRTPPPDWDQRRARW